MAEQIEPDIARRLCAALRSDSATDLVALLPDLQQQRIELAARSAQWQQPGRDDLARLIRYADASQRAANGKLFVRQRGRRVPGKVRDWSSVEVVDLRGRLLGLLAEAEPKPEPKRRRPHATLLDDRACELMRRWQHDDAKRDHWTLDELADALGTRRSNLIGKQRGRQRCPKFHEQWNMLQAARAEAKVQHASLVAVPRARGRART